MKLLKGLFAGAILFNFAFGLSVDDTKKKKSEPTSHDLSKAKEIVDKIRQPDPPHVRSSSETAKNISDRENKKEHQRDKERAHEANKKKKEPPSPH